MPQGKSVTCPLCRKELDGFESVRADGKESLPEPGNVSLCLYCTTVAIFTEDGLRLPTEEEALEIYGDSVIEKARAVLRAVKESDLDASQPLTMRAVMFEQTFDDEDFPITITIGDRETGQQLWRCVAGDFGATRVPGAWQRPITLTIETASGERRELIG